MKKIVITVVMVLLFIGTVFAQADELPLGEPIEGTLTDDQLVMEYSFSAKEGDRLTISASSTQFDTLLTVSDSDENVVVSNDDANGSLNSLIDNFIVTHDDDYTLLMTSSDGTEVGDYILTFNPIYLQKLAYGQHITGTLDESTQELVYQFEGNQGDVVSIRMTSDTVDSYISLSNSEYEMTGDDDSGGDLDAMIGAFTLPATDTYTIRATTFQFESYGEFTIYLDEVEATPITLDEPITGTLSDKPLYYSFTIDSSTLISAYVISGDGLLDTQLNIQNAEYGYSIGFDDDSGYIYDAELNNVYINDRGEYIVMITPATLDAEGDFELTIVSEPKPTLECDSSQTLLFNQKTAQYLYTMELGTRQTIILTFFGDNASLESLYSSATIDGTYLPIDFITDIDGQTTVEVQSVLPGQLDMNISDYAFRAHTFRLDVSCP